MYEKIKPIISADELKELLPVPKEVDRARRAAVKTVEDILNGDDKRLLCVVGPCSADDPDAVCEYAGRLADISREISDKLYVVMRVHTCKPRTRGEGYMGLLHAPNISDTTHADFDEGIRASRALHIRVTAESGLPTSDELVYPWSFGYIDDIIAYMTLGARTCECPEHRFYAGAADIPVGIKNPLSGDIDALSGSINAVSVPSTFVMGGMQVKSSGNRYAHAVLRGATDVNGEHIRNYSREYVLRLAEEIKGTSVVHGAVIDVGHSNSGKDPFAQCDVTNAVLNTAAADGEYKKFVKGIMLESYIEDGRGGGRGRSITDGCLGIEKTKRLLLSVAERL